jgi:hypothetical protein
VVREDHNQVHDHPIQSLGAAEDAEDGLVDRWSRLQEQPAVDGSVVTSTRDPGAGTWRSERDMLNLLYVRKDVKGGDFRFVRPELSSRIFAPIRQARARPREKQEVVREVRETALLAVTVQKRCGNPAPLAVNVRKRGRRLPLGCTWMQQSLEAVCLFRKEAGTWHGHLSGHMGEHPYGFPRKAQLTVCRAKGV